MNKETAKYRLIISFFIAAFFFSVGCVSHLERAKEYYNQGEKRARYYQTETALSFYKRAHLEIIYEAKKHPSAQAFVLKGLTELNLELWPDAKESFQEAFFYGFEKGEEWAQQLSLYGLAVTLDEFGLAESALKIYGELLKRSKMKPITLLAAQSYTDLLLKKAQQKKGKDLQAALAELLKSIDSLISKDMSCGFYHYLRSQILVHIQDYHASFEAAAMARELGLPTVEILRDNDNHIIFCYKKLKTTKTPEEYRNFLSLYQEWIKKWNWRGPETPDWKTR